MPFHKDFYNWRYWLKSEFLLMSVRQKQTDDVDIFLFILYLQIDNLPDV